MLLLLTIALVLVAAITLLIGIISDQLPLIFVSIFCSLGAGATLLVLSSASKKRSREGGAPAAAAPAPDEAPARVTETPSALEQIEGAEPVADVPAPAIEREEPAAAATEAFAPAPAASDFPIANYDQLKVNEIVPLLDDLDLDELDMVLEREENNKNRATIISRVNELMDRLEAEEEAASAPATEALPPAVPVGDAAATPPAAAAAAIGGDDFPIENYDRLSVEEILGRLPDLDDEQLELVYEREDSGAGRTAILDRVDEILDEREGVGVGAPASQGVGVGAPAGQGVGVGAPAESPAAGQSEEVAQAEEAAAVTEEIEAVAEQAPTGRKAPAKKASTKKAAAKKAATKKAAAPVKVAAKKAAAPKKAAVKKAAAPKKAATQATATKKAPAKKAAKKAR